MNIQRFEQRDQARLKFHYDIECELADRLRHSSRAERIGGLYGHVYNELFRRVSDHPQHIKRHHDERTMQVGMSIRALRPWLNPDVTFLEIGAGDADLSLTLASQVHKAIALDVAELDDDDHAGTPGFEFVLSNGIDLPLGDGTVDVAYSNQLIEHLHPDDALEQMQEVRRVLRPGGVYLCSTPNRLNGPHDISQRYADTARGFHLKEYTYGDLARLMRSAGFDRLETVMIINGWRMSPPLALVAVLEAVARIGGRGFAGSRLVEPFLRIQIAATRS
ncbi:MAG: class I SAM-dependent methyltransferase [Geminicoccaceae bacterium]|nr:class I SAM-dependent methyltransferase [Geminicoccaceae bacterium]